MTQDINADWSLFTLTRKSPSLLGCDNKTSPSTFPMFYHVIIKHMNILPRVIFRDRVRIDG